MAELCHSQKIFWQCCEQIAVNAQQIKIQLGEDALLCLFPHLFQCIRGCRSHNRPIAGNHQMGQPVRGIFRSQIFQYGKEAIHTAGLASAHGSTDRLRRNSGFRIYFDKVIYPMLDAIIGIKS